HRRLLRAGRPSAALLGGLRGRRQRPERDRNVLRPPARTLGATARLGGPAMSDWTCSILAARPEADPAAPTPASPAPPGSRAGAPFAPARRASRFGSSRSAGAATSGKRIASTHCSELRRKWPAV